MIKKGYHVAVVGATGAVGQKIIELLENEKKFNIVEVALLSSKRSAGKVVPFLLPFLSCSAIYTARKLNIA